MESCSLEDLSAFTGQPWKPVWLSLRFRHRGCQLLGGLTATCRSEGRFKICASGLSPSRLQRSLASLCQVTSAQWKFREDASAHTADGGKDGTNEAGSLLSRLFLTLSLSDTPSVKLMVNSSTLGTFSLFFSVWYSVRVFTTTWMTKVTCSAQRLHTLLKMCEYQAIKTMSVTRVVPACTISTVDELTKAAGATVSIRAVNLDAPENK